MLISGVGVIIQNQDHQFLLHLRDGNTKHFTNQWCLVGGSVVAGEDPVEAAVREVQEETNLTLKNPMLVEIFKWENRTIALIVGDVDTHDQRMVLGEGAALKYFTGREVFDLLASLHYTNPYLDQLQRYLERQGNVDDRVVTPKNGRSENRSSCRAQ
jgi:8-oxo-dGTP pyrophosphatase MutT (NUDIX family)